MRVQSATIYIHSHPLASPCSRALLLSSYPEPPLPLSAAAALKFQLPKNLNSKLGCVVVNLSHSFFKDIKSGIEREATFLGNTLENGKIIVVRNLKKPDAGPDIFISLRTILNNIPFACIGFNSSGENILNLELASPAKRRFQNRVQPGNNY